MRKATRTPRCVQPSRESRIARKVLCVTSYALSDKADSWRALNVAGGLREQGYEVAVQQYVRTPPTATTLDWGGRFSQVRCEIVVSSRPSCFVKHLRYVLRDRYDVVIGNNVNGALFSVLGRLTAPLVLDMHGDMAAELSMEEIDSSTARPIGRQVRKSLYRLAEAVTCRLSSRIWCVSRTMMSTLRGRGIRSEKMLYAPNGVDLEFFRPIPGEQLASFRSQLGIPPDGMLVGYLGRFHRWQGVEAFVEAARSFADPRVEFLIVGGTETKREGNIRFVGEVPLERMPLYYAICDVVALPRPRHPATEVAAPTKFAEYVAMGKPVLLTDVGDAARLVEKYGCGIVVHDNSPAELHNGIGQMKRCSGEMLLTMGKAARRLAEHEFDFEKTKQTLARCLEELVGPP